MGKSLNGRELGIGISQRKDGIYQARFTNQLGKRRTIYDKNLSELRKKLRNEQFNNDIGMYTKTDKYTLNQWYDVWINTFKKHCRPTTLEGYRSLYKTISEQLGDIYLKDLNTIIIQRVFNDMPNDSYRECSKKILSNILNKAVDSNLILSNPARKVSTRIDGIPKDEQRVLTKQEEQLVLKYSKDCHLNNFIIVALGTGMRQGEIRALQKEDVDFENNCIYVRHTLCYINKKGFELHEPKTYSGKRIIPMTSKVRKALRNQIKKRELMKDKYPSYIFTTTRGQPLHRANIKICLDSIVNRIRAEDCDFQPITPHTLRHTFATRAIEKNINPKVLQKLLGHSDIKITLNTYCHTTNEKLYEAIEILDQLV